MKYPRPEAPRSKAKRLRAEKAERSFEYQIVRKEVHGEMIDVKVFKPWWAQGHKTEAEHLGLYNPFNSKSFKKT